MTIVPLTIGTAEKVVKIIFSIGEAIILPVGCNTSGREFDWQQMREKRREGNRII